jgi:hypothetical protein
MGRDGWRDIAEKCSMGLYQRLGWTQWEEGEDFECSMDARCGEGVVKGNSCQRGKASEG